MVAGMRGFDKVIENGDVMDELKPCPFCGKRDMSIWCVVSFRVRCDWCGVKGEKCSTEQQAIKAWNTRVSE